MSITLRPAVPADRAVFAELLAAAADLEAYENVALDQLVDHAFGPEAFVRVVLAEDAGTTVGAMAHYLGFNDSGLTVNVIFMHILEERRLGSAFHKFINHARYIASDRGAASLNLAGAIFDERVCGMLQAVRREGGAMTSQGGEA